MERLTGGVSRATGTGTGRATQRLTRLAGQRDCDQGETIVAEIAALHSGKSVRPLTNRYVVNALIVKVIIVADGENSIA